MKWLWLFPKENKKPRCSYLAAKYLSNGKNGLTNPPLKYPASRKVLFDTERLSGRTWARLWLGNGKLVSGMMFGHATLLRDACHNLYQFTRFSWSQSDRLHSIWRRKKDFSLYSTTHPRAFGFRILYFLFFYREDNIFWQLNPHGNNYANSA